MTLRLYLDSLKGPKRNGMKQNRMKYNATDQKN